MLKLLKTAAVTSLAAFSMTAALGEVAYAQSSSQFDTARSSAQFSNSDRRSRDNGDQVLGGVVGALAGGVIGSQVAGRGSRTEGAVIGGLLGGVTGAAIAGNDSRSRRNSGFNRGFNRSTRFNRGFSSQLLNIEACNLRASSPGQSLNCRSRKPYSTLKLFGRICGNVRS